MTTKRFMLDDCGELIDLNNHKFINYGKECCNLLNEQHETIERLKQNVGELLSVSVEKELLEENEQLKKEVKSLREHFIYLIGTALEDKECRKIYAKGLLEIFDDCSNLDEAKNKIKEYLE